MRALLSLLLLGILLGSIGWTTYTVAGNSRAMRRRLLVLGSVGVGGAIFAVAWFTPRIPETPGSPGTMVMLLLLWLVAGGAGVVGLATLVGAALAKPREE